MRRPVLSTLALVMAAALTAPLHAAEQPPAAASPVAARPAPAPSPDTVLARVDGSPITQRDLDIATEDMGDRLPNMPEAQKREYLMSYLIDLKIGARAAADAKVGETPDFARRLAYTKDKLLLDDYLAVEAKKAATPEAAKTLYEETVKGLKPEEEVHARHILVPDEAQAKAISARIKGGEDFSKVAGEVSKDPGSAREGGDLGWFTKERMVPEFAEAAFKMQPGQVSDPVKSQFGWHVIKVEGRRTKPVPTYDELKDQIENYVARKAQQDMILKLRSQAKIERLDEAKAAPAADGTKAAPAASPAVPVPDKK